jgi:hypothetical protein
MTRGPQLGRELSYEESIFLTPGLKLFAGKAFSWDWGVLVPDASAFHKPPLLSLLLGLSAKLGPDPVAAARFIPFLSGLIALLAVAWTTRNLLACGILLAAPLTFAASVHLQTDGTVGIAGYSLVCVGVIGMLERRAFGWPIISIGLVILWLGKLEIAVVATIITAICIAAGNGEGRLGHIARLVGVTLVGVLLLATVCYALNSTTKSTFSSAWAELTGTVTRITKSSIQAQAAAPIGLGPGRHALVTGISKYGGWHTVAALLAPTALLLVIARTRLREQWRPLTLLFLAGAIPFLIYLGVGFPGDGFPRYFVWPLVPWAMLLGYAWRLSERTAAKAAAAALSMALLVPAAGICTDLATSPAHPAAPRRESGYKDAALLLRGLLRSGAPVVAPEPAAFYLTGYPVYVQESFEPYPNRHETVRGIIPNIAGAIVLADPEPLGITKEIVDHLRVQNALVQRTGSFLVYAVPDLKPDTQTNHP